MAASERKAKCRLAAQGALTLNTAVYNWSGGFYAAIYFMKSGGPQKIRRIYKVRRILCSDLLHKFRWTTKNPPDL
jgi:hypothetical protein